MNIKLLINKYKNKSEFLKFQSIKICLASPKKIKQWTQISKINKDTNLIVENSDFLNLELFNKSKVLNPKTFNYKTLKPEKGGLFCETIFGSLKNISNRRYKLGYIELIFPVIHIWYLKGSISYISILLNLKKKNLESVAYCLEFLSNQVKSFKHNLNYINFSSVIKNTLIDNKSIMNLSIFKSNYKLLLLYIDNNDLNVNLISKYSRVEKTLYKFDSFNKINKKFIKHKTINEFEKKINYTNEYRKKNIYFLKENKKKKIYKLKTQMIGLDKRWISNIKLKNEPTIILRLSNPISLIFNNLKINFNKFYLNKSIFNNRELKINYIRNKIKSIIIKKNSYSIDFPVLLFFNNKILQKLILNKHNSYFIIKSSAFELNKKNLLVNSNEQINQNLYNIKKSKNLILLYNSKIINRKTYFTNINIFIDFDKYQEFPFKIFQTGYSIFNNSKITIKLNYSILNYFIFNFIKHNKINNKNLNNILLKKNKILNKLENNFKFKNYKVFLEEFIWWFFLQQKQENFKLGVFSSVKHFEPLFITDFKFNNLKLKNSLYSKHKINKNNREVKYVSNILSEFYKKYDEFENIDFINNTKLIKIKITKKFQIKKFYNQLIKLKKKINNYNMNSINNLILLEKYYNQDEYYSDKLFSIKSFNLVKNKETNLIKVGKILKLENNKKFKKFSNFKINSKKSIFFNNLSLIKILLNNNKYSISEYCFSLLRFQYLLKNLTSNYKFNFSNYFTKINEENEFLEPILCNNNKNNLKSEYNAENKNLKKKNTYNTFSNYNIKENKIEHLNIFLNEMKKNKLLLGIENIKNISFNNLKNIESIFLLSKFEKNLEDKKMSIIDLKLKRKLKNHLVDQFYLYKKTQLNFFKINFIPRFLKINKKENNFIYYSNLLNLKYYYNRNHYNIKAFLKNPLGNNKFCKFITSILFTTIQKSLITCKIKLFKKNLIKYFYSFIQNVENNKKINKNLEIKILENYTNINKFLVLNEKKQLITFFLNNYGQLTELIVLSPNFFENKNFFQDINNKNLNQTSNLSNFLNKEFKETELLNNDKSSNTFFDLYDFDLKKNKITNFKIKNPLWLTNLNKKFNYFSYIWLDKKYLIILQKETKNFDLKICLNILQKDFKYILKNNIKNKYFNQIFFELNKKKNYKFEQLDKLNKNENLINTNFNIYINKIFQKIISYNNIYDHYFTNLPYYEKYDFINFSLNLKNSKTNNYKLIESLLNSVEIDNIFSIIDIDIKSKVWNSKLQEPSFNNLIQLKKKFFIYEQTIKIDVFKNIFNSEKSNNYDYSNFTKLLEKYLFKYQLHLNKYYTINKFFLWNNQTDWKIFLFYMTKIASINDKIIPCYIDRSITFDQPQIGAIAIKNILKDFNTSFYYFNYTNKIIKTRKSNSKLQKKTIVNSSKDYNFINMYNINITNTLNNKIEIICIELLIKHIKEKILNLNNKIKYYEDFLKFRILFSKKNPYLKSNSKIKNRIKNSNKIDTLFSISLIEQGRKIFSNEYKKFIKIFRKLDKLRTLRSHLFRRLKLLQPFLNTEIKAEWMVLDIIPVLPPDLRPILVLDSQQVAVSDLNKLYQKVIFRNERLKRLSNDFHSLNISPEMRYAQRLLQESVDALLENGKGDSKVVTSSNNRPLKSLSDMIKGKKGRFRQNLLGKRVDYSGRSVIVVGPNLKLYECGLPQEIAIELFQPFLIRQLLLKKFVKNFISAKKFIKNKPKIIWTILNKIMENRPILLNRAPTLHRLSIQAFKPKLISGRAILLHPLVCSAFNADFDGDQMAVHVPIFYQACSEAWRLLCSRNNLISPATGDPIIVPSQDMVLGSYYLTTLDKIKRIKNFNYFNFYLFSKINKNNRNLIFKNFNTLKAVNNNLFLIFTNINQVFQLFNQQILELHTIIWLKFNYLYYKKKKDKVKNKIEFNLNYQNCLEIQVDLSGNISKIYSEYQTYYNKDFKTTLFYIKTTPGRILFNKYILEILNY